ncbi:hypothetical protein GCM10010123_37830 [Pilimelia anulata]|uniref:HTH lysR-type domain-containing protein n=1 Tax=Pilimelia anulata TaxID=53371 RepID=A0A8J3BEC4_9ACTN|nr:LysR family transcriptional regulator [Pilimelia anulata]GGK04334.1 hypothetical protein GCM10010123_37830 [Pilimelia anulata]
MELGVRQLRVVRAIAEKGSPAAAARALGLTRAAVVEVLGRAERAAGGRLFDPADEPAAPTELGRLVLTHARRVLAAFGRLEAMAPDQAPSSGLLRVNSNPSLVVSALPLAVYRALNRSVELRIGSHDAVWLDQLVARRLDVALLLEFPGLAYRLPAGVARAVVAVEPIFVAVAADHRLADRTEVPLTELAGETCGSVASPTSEWERYVAGVCRGAGFEVRIREVGAAEAWSLVRDGSIAMLTQAAAREQPGIAVLPLAGAPLRAATSLFWAEDGPLADTDIDLLWAELVDGVRGAAEQLPLYRSWLRRNRRWRSSPARRGDEHDPLA